MKYSFERNGIQDARYVGGKGRQLQLLYSWGMNVPDFFIISTEAYDYFKEKAVFPDSIERRVKDFLSIHSEVSFRSSMIHEDRKDASFAGIFETVLNVQENNWQEALKKVYASIEGKRVEEYLKDKKIRELKMAVVVQKMVHCEKSGVLFTRSPVNPTSLAVIDAGWGLGEGIVSGTVETDSYKIDRMGNTVHSVIKNEKEVLSEKEREELFSQSLVIEEKLGMPADIEWGYKEGKLYFFQVRPVSREFSPLGFFVDTNLSESYPGVVSPFTADFVQKAYENVFLESAIILGANGRRLDDLHFHYQRLISYLDGHLYYDLEHYYAVLKALPGGDKNIQNWHKMIGGSHVFHGIKSYDTAPTLIETVQSLWKLLCLGFSHEKIFKKLTADFENIKREIEEETQNKRTAEELINFLNELVKKPLGFGFTVVNDIFVMLGLSLLTKLVKRKGLTEEDIIGLLHPEDGVDSILPLRKLQDLIPKFQEGFLEAFSKEDLKPGLLPYEKIFRSLEEKGYSKEVDCLKSFLREYGERSFEELKIESLPLSHSPNDFYHLLSWYKNPSSLEYRKASPGPEFRGLIGIVHRFTKRAIKTREETRLFRGKFYNLVRVLLLKIEETLKREDPTWQEFENKDFFSLTANEWKGMTGKEAQEKIRERSPWKTHRKVFPEFICWVKDEALITPQEKFISGEIKGQGVSSGEVEGKVLILENPTDAFNESLEGVILVTKNTDPAWVYVMSQSKGLISEKGSLLSHTAIIGRELGIPTIVGVKEGTKLLRTGEKIRINGSTGEIKKL